MIRVTKCTNTTRIQAVIIRLAAVVIALVVSALFILMQNHNPLDVYISMITGAWGKWSMLKATIVDTIPLIITSLGVAIAFKMKFWNIGAEGQAIMGAFFANLMVVQFPGLPGPLTIFLMFIAGIVGGALWAFPPAFFKAKYGANETLFTLMMNYIAMRWIKYLASGPWKDPKANGQNRIAILPENTKLPELFDVHVGWIIALALAVMVYIFLNKTKKGYEIAVIGESENTARYAGMNVRQVVISAVMLSGALAGLMGMIQLSAVSGQLTSDIAGGVGFTAITVAWLAQLSAPGIILVSFLFSTLEQGISYIQSDFNIPLASAKVLQALILFFVLGSEFFIQYRVSFKKNMTSTVGKEGK